VTTTREILAERQLRHGDFRLQACIVQALKTVIQDHNYRLNDPQRESLDMIMGKVSRILAGDPNFHDHWDDIAGYAVLVADMVRPHADS